jgi:uroporphyrin-III C-methyltransferase
MSLPPVPDSDDFAGGTVWLVGAGPGDPELLTAKAIRLLGRAELVFHDALVGPAILDLVPPGAERISVGKRSGRHSQAQEDINAALVEAARSGRRVLRLKGGDPSIFGRSAEEIEALTAAGIRVRICPGVTAASAAAASAVTSLTLRGLARRLTLVTAHARAGEVLALDWAALAAPDMTLAVYMGRGAAAGVAAGLIGAGRDPATPVLLAMDVSLPGERLIRGRLDALGILARTVSETAPALLLIGDAFERGPGRAEAPALAEEGTKPA